MLRSAWTFGTRVSPWSFLDFTTHVRARWDHSDYDDQAETAPGPSTARSAFFDALTLSTKEVATRVTLKLPRQIRPSFRFKLQAKDYTTRTEGQSPIDGGMNSYLFGFDLSSQPRKDLFFTGSFFRERAWTNLDAASATTATTPRFNADINTWLFSADYLLSEKMTVMSSLQYSIATNFNDFTSIGLPLGADYRQLDLSLGLRWALKLNVTIEPRFDLYRYDPDSKADTGAYNAYQVWLKTTFSLG